ncbi:MAG: hypothetical protein IJJ33_09295 [Victivallales bacterium]|nr:hypothetical protein [Victivallales bacterium]
MKTIAGLLLWMALFAGAFEVREENGRFLITHGGREIVAAIDSSGLGEGSKASQTRLPDGGRAWNRWSEQRDTRIRQEVAVTADGSEVEITMIGECDAYPASPERQIVLTVPWRTVAGKRYRGLIGNGRDWREGQGVFADGQPPVPDVWRYLEIDGLVFDFNPIGAGDDALSYTTGAIRGVWRVSREGEDLRFTSGSTLPERGGMTGAKVVIREGRMESDFPSHHALRTYHYPVRLPISRLYSFGSGRHGRQYAAADTSGIAFGGEFGWLGEPELRVISPGPEGAFYSAVAGSNAVFRIAGLVPGLHFVQVASGNFSGAENGFAIRVNGRVALEKSAVAARELLTVALPVWVEGDSVDIQFDGDFLVSAIGSAFLMARSEDFNYRRGYWVSDGYEPAVIYRNDETKPDAVFQVAVERIPMPVPGEEDSAPRRPFARERELPDAEAPEMAWTRHACIHHLGYNLATMAEYREPALLERRLDELQAQGATVVQVSGMHSRHTYVNSIERGKQMVAQVVKAAHARGLKVMDHHDATLCWNEGAGFRTVSERLAETVRGLPDQMPNASFCIMNPVFNRTYRDYLLDLVRAGVDAFQCDEVYFFGYGCGCRHCRAAFQADTGWQLPLNELDARLGNQKSLLWKTYLEWRKVKVADWFLDFRREAKAINPHLTLSAYTTHWGFRSPAASLGKGVDLVEMARAVNLMGTEVMPRNCLAAERSLVPYRKMYNSLRSLTGIPLWACLYGSHNDARYFGWAACNLAAQTAFMVDKPRINETDFLAFAASEDNMDFTTARPMAQVALYFSRASRDWNAGMNMGRELFGLAQTLEEIHLPYQVIAENLLTAAGLAPFRVLAIGAAGCLDNGEVESILAFARQGGTVLMSGVAGFFDELGSPRPAWPFAPQFGFTPKLQRGRRVVRVSAGHGGASAELLEPCAVYLPGAPDAVPCRTSLLAVDDSGNEIHTAYEAPCGKGRLVYQAVPVAGNLFQEELTVGNTWKFRLDEGLASLYRGYLARVLSPAAVWSVKAPTKVHAEIYRQGDAFVAHFLNATGNRYQVGELVEATPLQPSWPALAQDIVFSLPVASVREVYAVSPDFQGRVPLEFTVTDGTLTATLPAKLLTAYALVWIR